MFKKDFGLLKSALPQQFCSIFTQYALFDMYKNHNPANNLSVTPNVHSKYSDSLAESVLLQFGSSLIKNIRSPLIPTHSYLRVYKSGDYLKESVETNPACELSVNIYLGSNYEKKKVSWPLHVVDEDGNDNVYNCNVGDAVVYMGNKHKTYRKPLDFDDDLYHVELVLHYVDANGPYAQEYKYNKRSFVGI
jgi:hypothetical protein